MTELYAIAMVNALLCAVCIVILLCRLNAMGGHQRVKRIVVASHAIGVGAMFCSMFRPFIGEWPGYASLLVGVYILWELWSSRDAWRSQYGCDMPPESATIPAPMENDYGTR